MMSITREQALGVFSVSQQRDTAVGLRIIGRKNLLIILIQQIVGLTDDTTELHVRSETIYGEQLTRSSFKLGEVESICNLRVRYNDPFYIHLRELRSNIRAIREEVGIERRLSA